MEEVPRPLASSFKLLDIGFRQGAGTDEACMVAVMLLVDFHCWEFKSALGVFAINLNF